MGTKDGGRKTKETILSRHGADYFARIGSIGGSTPTDKKKGFAANPELARQAGIKGGAISRRGSKKQEA